MCVYIYICIHTDKHVDSSSQHFLRLYLGLVLGVERHSRKVFGSLEIQRTCLYIYNMHVCPHISIVRTHINIARVSTT